MPSKKSANRVQEKKTTARRAGALYTVGHRIIHRKITFAREFITFLQEYRVVGLAVGFVMGVASTGLIKSMVDNIIMPLVTPFVPSGAWRTATISIGPIVIKWGAFVAEIINFSLIALIVFIIAKNVIREEKQQKSVEKK